ncbi:type III secretion system needle filament protein VscF, partial [Vibrio sp. Y184]
MSFYDATNSVNLDDVKTKLEQQAKDANKSVTDAIKNLETNADDPSKLAELQHAINK